VITQLLPVISDGVLDLADAGPVLGGQVCQLGCSLPVIAKEELAERIPVIYPVLVLLAYIREVVKLPGNYQQRQDPAE
jgi:hypothetical protein